MYECMFVYTCMRVCVYMYICSKYMGVVCKYNALLGV